jgi:anthranilate synthase component 1
MALYASLSDGGRRPHTFLLESADRSRFAGERSLIGARMALHLTADLASVRIEALTPNGDAALVWLRDSLGIAGAPPSDRVLVVPIERAPGRAADERGRFRQPSPLDLLRHLQRGPALAARPNDWCHLLVGVLAYDLIDYFEQLPAGGVDPLDQPVAEWWLPDQLVVIDHVRQQSVVVATAWGGDDYATRYHDAHQALERLVGFIEAAGAAVAAEAEPEANPTDPDATVDQDDGAYAEVVSQVQEFLRAGDAYQIVPSRTFALPCTDPLDAYGRLRRQNPSPYLFYLRGEDRILLGASPETCLRVEGPTRAVSVVPIAGTAPRGRHPDGTLDHDADTRNEVALRLDLKEAAEHLMLVDLARNDVARVSRPGTRRVARLLDVERYAHVMHLVSEVTGTLADGIDALEAYAATMNMGTLVGAPKVRAAEILRTLEPSRRGFYGGAVGYLLDDGTLETAIIIRSAVVQGGVAFVRAGAGVVLDSDPRREALETRHKARGVLRALAPGAPAHV